MSERHYLLSSLLGHATTLVAAVDAMDACLEDFFADLEEDSIAEPFDILFIEILSAMGFDALEQAAGLEDKQQDTKELIADAIERRINDAKHLTCFIFRNELNEQGLALCNERLDKIKEALIDEVNGAKTEEEIEKALDKKNVVYLWNKKKN